MMRFRLVLGVVLAAGVALASCDSQPPANDGPVGLAASGDPIPRALNAPVDLDDDAARHEQGPVTVEVPAGAVRSGGLLTFGAELGMVDGEHFAHPVSIEVPELLLAPVELRWNIGALTDDQRASIVPLRWDEELQVWDVDTSNASVAIIGDELIVTTTDFSWRSWSWAADLGQSVGERTGSRREGPTCDGELPGWVTNVVDPGAGTSAAAIQVCFEPDDDEMVTVRIVNNRPFTQRLDMSEGRQSWAWTWPGNESFGVSAAVDVAARQVFDSPTTHLLPPLSETAVGVARPEGGGSHFIAASASVDAATFLVDVVDYLLGQVSPGGFDSDLANEATALVYECGGSAALAGTDLRRISTDLVEVVASCIMEVMTSDSSYGARFDTLRRQMIDSASNDTVRAQLIRENRALHQLAGAVRILEAGKLTFYFTDQLQNAYIGDLTLSISGTGLPGELGAWTPVCDDLSTDSNRLYRNLALRDPFYDTSRELWEFEAWGPAATQAIRPLEDCDDDHLEQLADLLPRDWGDPRAAQVVADRLTELVDSRAGAGASVAEMSQIEVANAFYRAFLDGDAQRARHFTLPGQQPDSYEVLVRDRPSPEFLAAEVWSCWDLYCEFMDNVTPGWKLVVEPRDGRYVVTGVLHEVGHPVADWPDEELTEYCVIDTTPLNLRSGPGTEHPAMTAIPVDACGVYAYDDQRDLRWRSVRWQGRLGFVASSMLQPAAATSVTQPDQVSVPPIVEAFMDAWWRQDRAALERLTVPGVLAEFETSPEGLDGYRIDDSGQCFLGSSAAGACAVTLITPGGAGFTWVLYYREVNSAGDMIVYGAEPIGGGA